MLHSSFFFQSINLTLLKLTKTLVDVSKPENVMLKCQLEEAERNVELDFNKFNERESVSDIQQKATYRNQSLKENMNQNNEKENPVSYENFLLILSLVTYCFRSHF